MFWRRTTFVIYSFNTSNLSLIYSRSGWPVTANSRQFQSRDWNSNDIMHYFHILFIVLSSFMYTLSTGNKIHYYQKHIEPKNIHTHLYTQTYLHSAFSSNFCHLAQTLVRALLIHRYDFTTEMRCDRTAGAPYRRLASSRKAPSICCTIRSKNKCDRLECSADLNSKVTRKSMTDDWATSRTPGLKPQ